VKFNIPAINSEVRLKLDLTEETEAKVDEISEKVQEIIKDVAQRVDSRWKTTQILVAAGLVANLVAIVAL
jgi:tetrahydromethanopterin S-methyltransferase subunit G|tara:strand:- start:29 stop:238 length:210 start_codon:yes stop_codon:yes gene_type:complete